MILKPMLCARGTTADLERTDMAAEMKADGTRGFLIKREDWFEIRNRHGQNYTLRLPEIHREARKFKGTFTIDGEIVYFNEEGRTLFEGSQRRCATSNLQKAYALMRRIPLTFLAFEILELNGRDLTKLPYLERKSTLKAFLDAQKSRVIKYLGYTTELKQFFQQTIERDEEGLILKRLNSTYQPKRSRDWIKVTRSRKEECDVVGYTLGEGKRAKTFGSLVLAQNGKHVGNVGSGFTDQQLLTITATLRKSPKTEPPFTIDEPYNAISTNLRLQVRFYERSKNGLYRFPSFVKPLNTNLPI